MKKSLIALMVLAAASGVASAHGPPQDFAAATPLRFVQSDPSALSATYFKIANIGMTGNNTVHASLRHRHAANDVNPISYGKLAGIAKMNGGGSTFILPAGANQAAPPGDVNPIRV